MGRDRPYPTRRPIGTAPVDEPGCPAEATNIPWIDGHLHAHTLSWSDREKFDLSGARALVSIAASYYWSPYRPVRPDDVRFLWDDALRRAVEISRKHFFDLYVAMAVHTWSRVEAYEDLLEVLPEYCALDEVVAIGETGIESIQHTAPWGLDGQREVITRQMEIADRVDLPVLLHTPGGSKKGDLPPWFGDRYEEGNENFTDHLLDPENVKQQAVEIDVECMDDAGLADEQVVVDHADASVVPYVMGNTDCYLAFTLTWFREVDVGDVAAAIEEYGPDRIMVDTDLLGPMRGDPFTMKRTIFDLLRAGVDAADVRQVVYENPKEVFDLDVPE